MNKLFCAETLWDSDISQTRTSYKSLIDLVRNETKCKTSYFSFNTPEELQNLFDIFAKKKYDIMYLAGHMENGKIRSGLDSEYYIDYIDLIVKNSHNLKDKIIHLAGCSSLFEGNIPYKLLDLVEKTDLKMISGYEIDTYTTESSAMDLLYLSDIILGGVDSFVKNHNERYSQLSEITAFSFCYREED